MIRINLLPPADRKREVRSARLFKTITLVVFSIYFCVVLWKVYGFYEANQELEKMQERQASLQSIQVLLDTSNSKMASVSAKAEVVRSLAGQKRPWQEMMSHLALLSSDQLWFKEVSNDKEAIKLTGSAVDYDAVAVMLQQLERDEFFKEPQLLKAEKDKNQSMTNFEIQVKLKGL